MRLLPRRFGNKQRLFVLNAHEAGSVAARRAIEASRPGGRERTERRRLDEFPIIRVDVIDLFDDRGAIGLVVERFETLPGGDTMVVFLLHRHALSGSVWLHHARRWSGQQLRSVVAGDCQL